MLSRPYASTVAPLPPPFVLAAASARSYAESASSGAASHTSDWISASCRLRSSWMTCIAHEFKLQHPAHMGA
jgi:hypothetical protein